MKILVSLAAAATAAILLAPISASAHTDSDIIAVPAGGEATVKLKPTHGCAGSPTVEVAIQAPVEGATAGEVEGWTATAEADGKGNTVLEWTGGSLPSDQTGEFPVTFTAPDTVGELLTFPSVQTCENGEDLSWISGDPADDFPAPRLLILPAGSEAAGELEEIAADAPGRSKLAEIVDVDNPTETTTTAGGETITTAAETTTTGATTTTAPSTDDESASDDDSGSSAPVIAGIIVVLAVVAGGAVIVLRRRSAA